MATRKTIQKNIRLSPEQLDEIEACMREQGINDFAAFAHMAFRTLLKRFDDEQKSLPANLVDLIERFEELQKHAQQTLNPPHVAEPKHPYPDKKP